jgi:hypothetical protein
MAKKGNAKDLKPLKDGPEGLSCYRCGADNPTQFKWMKTPSGGKYKRAWCDLCLHGIPVEVRVDRNPEGVKIRPGTPVNVAFSGKLLHYVPNKTGDPEKREAVILVGTTGYTVNMSMVEEVDGG